MILNNENESSATSSVNRLSVRNLTGRFHKTLEVPAGSHGAVLYADGSGRVLPPGKHRLLTWNERLRGKSAGLGAYLFKSLTFPVQLSARGLLSGDGVLVEASLAGTVDIVYPLAWLRQGGETVDLSRAAVQDAFADIARRYSVGDLMVGLPARRLAEELRLRMDAVLQAQGLSLNEVRVISFWRADERVRAAELAQQLEERLQNLDLQKRMAAAETQAQFDDFMRQLDLDAGIAGLRILASEKRAEHSAEKQDAPSVQPALSGLIAATLDSLRGKDAKTSRWRLKKLTGASSRKHHLPPYWWAGNGLWIIILIIAGILGTAIVLTWAADASKEIKYSFLSGLWLLLLPLTFQGLHKLVEKREMLIEAYFQENEIGLLELVRSDCARLDRLVREQVSGDLRRCAAMLDDLVTRAYKAGENELAVRLRDLRKKFEDSAVRAVNSAEFIAGYLQPGLELNEKLLDDEEERLEQSAALAVLVGGFQQQYGSVVDQKERIASLEHALDAFVFNFSAREHAI